MTDMTLEQVANELRITARHGASLAPQTCHYLADAIDAAIKQREQDVKDAARYRWLLRNVGRAVDLLTDADLEGTPAYEIGDAIDSAMAKESGR